MERETPAARKHLVDMLLVDMLLVDMLPRYRDGVWLDNSGSGLHQRRIGSSPGQLTDRSRIKRFALELEERAWGRALLNALHNIDVDAFQTYNSLTPQNETTTLTSIYPYALSL
jgi:hypothetical protein